MMKANAVRQILEAAENAGDPEAVIALLADDAVLMVPDFPVQAGREACAAFLREVMPSLHEEFERRASYSSDDVAEAGDMAIDRGTFVIDVRPRAGGDVSQVTGKYLWMLRRSAAGEWRVTHMVVSRDEAWEPAFAPGASAGTSEAC